MKPLLIMLFALFVAALLWLGVIVPAEGQCEECCCSFLASNLLPNTPVVGTPTNTFAATATTTPTVTFTPTPAPQFAQGCYSGNGTDDRVIYSGIINPGLVLVYDRRGTGSADCSTYHIPETGGNSRATQNCSPISDSNSIQSVVDGSFTIGNSGYVNTNGIPYCWAEWGLGSNRHGTFTYTGNGSSPRTITVSGTPDYAAVQLASDNTANFKNHIYDRTNDMPTGVSYPWGNISVGSADTNFVTNLVANGVVVGSGANENGKSYFGWWFQGDSSIWGATVTWTGNGSSNGGCANAIDTKVVTSPCPVRYLLTNGCHDVGGSGSSCPGATGTNCPHAPAIFRGLNMGSAVVGPGNTGSDNFLSMWVNGAYGEVLGNLTDSQFTASGASSSASNLNNDGQPYYAWVTCASSTYTGSDSLTNWCFNTNTVACWEMDEASDITRANNDCTISPPNGGTFICGNSTCDCNLTTANTVAVDTTNKVTGTGSASFDGSEDLNCTFGNCGNEFNLAGSVTFGCFGRPTSDATETMLRFAGSGSNLAYSVGRGAAFDTATCTVVNTSNAAAIDDVRTPFLTNLFSSVVCQFNDPSDLLKTFLNGVGDAGTAATSMRSVSSGGMDIGVSSWVGNIDECFVYSGVLTDTDICRVCSCGFNGTLCSCLSSNPTIYTDVGRNGIACSNCALPVCNKISPG